MAKCVKCGKWGLFLKLVNGLCTDCLRIEVLKKEEADLIASIKNYKDIELKTKVALEEIKAKKEELYNQIAAKAKDDALKEIADKINEKNNELSRITANIELFNGTLNSIKDEKTKQERLMALGANKLLRVQTLFKSTQYSAQRYFEAPSVTQDILNELQSYDVDSFLSTTVKLKLNLMDIRELRKRYNLNNKVIQHLLFKYQSRYTTKANMSIYRLMVIALEAELQNVLYNLKYARLEKSIKDIKSITTKYQKIDTEGNQNIAPTVTKFIGEIEYLFIEAIKIEYEYYIQKERIKEEQREIRENIKIVDDDDFEEDEGE